MATVTIDTREAALIKLFDARCEGHQVRSLELGDFLCEYPCGRTWLCERKRVDDAAASIKDGRWREQTSRLYACGRKVFVIFEGDFRTIGSDVLLKSVVGAYLNTALKDSNVRVLRSSCVEETCDLLCSLVFKVDQISPRAPPGCEIQPPPALQSKRRRDLSPRSVAIRQLWCIPGISRNCAAKLMDHFGSLPGLQRALEEHGPSTFPNIKLDENKCIGKDSVKKLKLYLVEAAGTSEA